LIALPVVLGLPHVDVPKAAIDLGDQVQQLTGRCLLPDPVLDPLIERLVARHVVVERV
jgi:hypothetical protein